MVAIRFGYRRSNQTVELKGGDRTTAWLMHLITATLVAEDNLLFIKDQTNTYLSTLRSSSQSRVLRGIQEVRPFITKQIDLALTLARNPLISLTASSLPVLGEEHEVHENATTE